MGSAADCSTSGDNDVEKKPCSLGLVVMESETGGGESRRLRCRGKVREHSAPSTLPVGLAVRDVDREREGSGRTWSEVLLNLLIRSLNEGCRDLLEGAPTVGESEVERYAGRLMRDGPRLFAGRRDTVSVTWKLPIAMLFLVLVFTLFEPPVALGAVAAKSSRCR